MELLAIRDFRFRGVYYSKGVCFSIDSYFGKILVNAGDAKEVR